MTAFIVEYGSPQAICLKHNQIKKYRVRLTDGTTHLLLQNEKTTGQIAQWMNSGQLETIHSCEPTLETVFLDTTGGIFNENNSNPFQKTICRHRNENENSHEQKLIIMPIFSSIYFTYENTVPIHADGKINMDGYALSLGVLMNISMSVYCTAAALAEEKEKIRFGH